jgi:fatty acid desaturase
MIVIFWLVGGGVLAVSAPGALLLVGSAVYFGAFVGDSLLSIPEHVNLRRDAHGKIGARVIETHAFLAWLTRNQNLHAIHHAFPGLDWRALPTAYRQASLPGGTEIVRGYVRFHAGLLRELARRGRFA